MRLAAPSALVATALTLACPALAHAGMPSPVLLEVPRLRLQSISFFLLAFFLSAGLVHLLWNFLRKDFPALPRLTYPTAVGLVTLWGTLFVLVLTMISGARELMTPGAWVKQGSTYRLAQDAPPAPPPVDALEVARRQQLEALRFALWDHARRHGGHFPSTPAEADVPAERWQVSDASKMRYVYVGGLREGRGVEPLVYEPDIFGPQRFVLFSDGGIRLLSAAEIARARQEGKR